jgi:PAS domain S-box-containing protein
MTGYSGEELIGQDARILYPSDEEYQRVGTEKYRLMGDRGIGTIETRWQRKDGTIIDVLLSSTPIDAGDLSKGVTFSALDITDRKRFESMLKSLVESTSATTGRGFFRRLVRNLASGLDFKYAFMGQLAGTERERLRSLAFWDGVRMARETEFDLSGTASEEILSSGACTYFDRVRSRFPQDGFLAALDVESFVGIPLLTGSNEQLGILAVMDDQPLSEETAEAARSLLIIFASRATAEFERLNAEDQLRRANEELQAEHASLTEKNIALGEILNHMQRDKEDYRMELCEAVEQMFGPVINKLKAGHGQLSDRDLALLDHSLKSIVGRDIDQFRSNFSQLSPREMEICDLIRDGYSSKEISDALSISLPTVNKHREMIRRKLKIQNRDINLAAYLRYKL